MNEQMNDQRLTDCITPPPLSDDELFLALDDEADERIQKHLQACAYCAARLEHMREIEQGMHTALYRVGCPPSDDLADYVLGVASAASRAQTEQHVRTCVRCREEVQTLRMILKPVEAPAAEPQPEPLLDRLRDWMRGLERDLVTILLPAPLPTYETKRGPEDRERLLNYESGEISVMLRLEKVVDGLKVNGEILDLEQGGMWASGHIELTGSGGGRFLAVVRDDETFTFDLIKPGTYQLSIYAISERILRLEAIDLTM